MAGVPLKNCVNQKTSLYEHKAPKVKSTICS